MIDTRTDSATSLFKPNADAASEDYKAKVAEPTMRAIDGMPAEWRELVHEFGYVDVYRAYMRRWTVARVRSAAKNGVFKL